MKKTITLSLLLAASAMCAYADSTLEEIYRGTAITLSTTEQLPPSWTDTDSADSLVSTTVDGAEAGDVLAQIDFSFKIDGPTDDYNHFNILSIVSSGGTAYQVAAQLESSSGRGSSGKLYIGQNIKQPEDWPNTGITFSYGRTYENASLTLTAGAEAGSVTIALSLNGESVSITSTNKTLLTGDFVKLAVGGSSATGSLTVTSVKARKAESKDDDAVPEPTTATLSLLALAGLAARRRRK